MWKTLCYIAFSVDVTKPKTNMQSQRIGEGAEGSSIFSV